MTGTRSFDSFQYGDNELTGNQRCYRILAKPVLCRLVRECDFANSDVVLWTFTDLLNPCIFIHRTDARLTHASANYSAWLLFEVCFVMNVARISDRMNDTIDCFIDD